jgi:4,5-dihydroxyphthalate decarboxylase
MTKLQLSFAIGNYDRTRALIDSAVTIDGVDPVYMTLVPEEIFFRAFRAAEFDICELSLSSYTIQIARGESPYIAIPAFVSRAFRHTAIYVRTDRVRNPADLKGKKVGVPEYQLTANVWARAFLSDDYGVNPTDIHWVRGGIENPTRPEKIAVDLPRGVRLDNAPEGETISALLERGEIDGFIAPRPPSLVRRGHPNVGWLFPDPVEVAKDYFLRTGLFPIMHVIGVRRTLADRHPWLPGAVLKALEQAKEAGLRALSDTSAPKVTLPFVEERLKEARALMGEDFWPYGVESNRKVLDYFLDQHHAQGLSKRRVSVDELFHEATYESFKL